MGCPIPLFAGIDGNSWADPVVDGEQRLWGKIVNATFSG